MDGSERFAQWTRYVEASCQETVHSFWNRKLFRAVGEMFRTNEVLAARGVHVHQWIAEMYASQAAMFVRRELDKQANTMNLRSLLHDIEGHMDVLLTHSRARGLPSSSEEVRADREKLESKADPARQYAERVLAHRSGGPTPQLTFGELDRGLRAVLQTMRRYYAHVKATDLLRATPTAQFDPVSAFTLAWVTERFREPEDDEQVEE